MLQEEATGTDTSVGVELSQMIPSQAGNALGQICPLSQSLCLISPFSPQKTSEQPGRKGMGVCALN